MSARTRLTHSSDARDRRAARAVRDLVAAVHGATPAAEVVLAPGTAVALRLLFDALAVRRITLSASEYFGAATFPTHRIRPVNAERLAADVARRPTDAVVMSVVSWRGERLPLEATFAEIRRTLGRRAPLLVADFAHAGAAGFPPVRSTGADVVVGDAGKWITSPELADRIAYVWLRTPALRRVARRTFAALYLATVHPAGPLEGRWVDPEAARRLAAATRGRAGRRAELRRRHARDLALAEVLAWRLGLPAPSTPLVCVGPRQVPAWARREGLLWRTPDGAVRVTCRSDEASR